jgi:hypothetical protein
MQRVKLNRSDDLRQLLHVFWFDIDDVCRENTMINDQSTQKTKARKMKTY